MNVENHDGRASFIVQFCPRDKSAYFMLLEISLERTTIRAVFTPKVVVYLVWPIYHTKRRCSIPLRDLKRLTRNEFHKNDTVPSTIYLTTGSFCTRNRWTTFRRLINSRVRPHRARQTTRQDRRACVPDTLKRKTWKIYVFAADVCQLHDDTRTRLISIFISFDEGKGGKGTDETSFGVLTPASVWRVNGLNL